MINIIKNIIKIMIEISFVPILITSSVFSRLLKKNNIKPRLVWGSVPIINNSHWSRAMESAGFVSETFTTDFFSEINNRKDWDIILSEKYSILPNSIKVFLAFIESLFKYDIFFISFNGYFIGETLAAKLQALLFLISGKKTVIIPYGADAYDYSQISSSSLLHGLLMSYPKESQNQVKIQKNIKYWTKHGNAIIPCFIGPDGIGRWDVLIPSSLFLNLNIWKPCETYTENNGKDDLVTIVHAPNHRGFKGTEFIIDVINKLKDQGYKIDFILLEKMQNSEVRHILNKKADILIDQLIFTGNGLNALEGLASGLPVISNLENDHYILPFRRWSYFSECPIVSATPENLIMVLRNLIENPQLRKKLGTAGRKYMEKYHGEDSAHYFFNNIIKLLSGQTESLINLYHPLLGEYPKRKPKIEHPLKNNRIIN